MNFFSERLDTIKAFLSTQQFPLKDWANLGSWKYWTDGPLDSTSPYYAAGLVLFLLILVALELWRRNLKTKDLATPVYGAALIQISNLFYFVLILTPAYWFFRLQQLSYLSGRLLLGSIVLTAIIWLIYILFLLKRKIPAKRQLYLEKERFFRYLPTTGASKNSQGRSKK